MKIEKTHYLLFLLLVSFYSFATEDQTILNLNTNNVQSENTTATIHTRGSGKELRFKKNSMATFLVNSPEDAQYEVSINYSSKSYAPSLELTNKSLQITKHITALETKGHGNFKTHVTSFPIQLKKGSNKIEIASLRHNFYLKKIVLKSKKLEIIHTIPKKINSWEVDFKSDNVNKAARGSSFELRFGKGSRSSYKIENLDDNNYDLKVTYSSKKSIPKLNLTIDNEIIPVQKLEATSGHGSFKTMTIARNVNLKKAVSSLSLDVLSNNFYLRSITFDKSTTDLPEITNIVPGSIASKDFSSKNKGIVLKERGSAKEVQLKKNQAIEYIIDNPLKEKAYLQLKIDYSSARTTPDLNINLNDLDIEVNSLEKTSSHGNYQKKLVVQEMTLNPGLNTLKITSFAHNFYFKTLHFEKLSLNDNFTPIYQVNSGGLDHGTWSGDSQKDNEYIFTNNELNKYFYKFGSNDSQIIDLSDKGLTFDHSVTNDTEIEIFNKVIQDKLSEHHSAPGLHYNFKLLKGKYLLKLHLVSSVNSSKVRFKSNTNIDLTSIELSSTEKYKALTKTISFEHTNNEEFELSLLPFSSQDQILLAGLEILGVSDSQIVETPQPKKYYISPRGTGTKSGDSPKNSKSIKDLNTLIGRLSTTGGEILLLPNKGKYEINSSINIRNGGISKEKPVVIKTYRINNNSAKATLKGTRKAPWVQNSSSTGKEFLRLMSGANNLIFEDLQFENFGNGIFRIAQPISNLTIKNIRATNFTRLVENYKSGSVSNASVNGLTLKNIEAIGYTRGVIRLKYSSKNITIKNLLGDSDKQLDSESFPMGIAIDDYASNITIENSLLKNHRQVRSKSSLYFNGDGIATESKVSNVKIIDTVSTNNSDGGFDLKSTQTTLLRTLASNNKRNYRFWNPAEAIDITSLSPKKHGGSGNKVHFGTYGSRNFKILIENVYIYEPESRSRLFSVGENKGSSMKVEGGKIYTIDEPDITDSHPRVEISEKTQFINLTP